MSGKRKRPSNQSNNNNNNQKKQKIGKNNNNSKSTTSTKTQKTTSDEFDEEVMDVEQQHQDKNTTPNSAFELLKLGRYLDACKFLEKELSEMK